MVYFERAVPGSRLSSPVCVQTGLIISCIRKMQAYSALFPLESSSALSTSFMAPVR